jgi:probable rRNA maturation factor
MIEINFFLEGLNYTFKGKRKTKSWIISTITAESKRAGEINIIFCSDEYLYKLNIDYLHHDTYTDIISFNFSEQKVVVSGDIYISIERAKDNAKKFKQLLQTELSRLIIHGILHLCGYKDKSQKDKALMTQKEDYYLSLLP